MFGEEKLSIFCESIGREVLLDLFVETFPLRIHLMWFYPISNLFVHLDVEHKGHGELFICYTWKINIKYLIYRKKNILISKSLLSQQ